MANTKIRTATDIARAWNNTQSTEAMAHAAHADEIRQHSHDAVICAYYAPAAPAVPVLAAHVLCNFNVEIKPREGQSSWSAATDFESYMMDMITRYEGIISQPAHVAETLSVTVASETIGIKNPSS